MIQNPFSFVFKVYFWEDFWLAFSYGILVLLNIIGGMFAVVYPLSGGESRLCEIVNDSFVSVDEVSTDSNVTFEVNSFEFKGLKGIPPKRFCEII